jgi:outer membrane protein assembly factor BamE
MGTPLIQDSFHGNRWDYVYQMREAGKITEQRRVILDFEKDLLKTVRGDVIPSGSSKSEGADTNPNTGTRVVEPYKKPEEKSLINKLKFWEKDDAAQAKSVVGKCH